jgi:hypothetical protein
MKIIVDTRNGIAGDIFSAGLIGLGADDLEILPAMEYAGNLLGKARVGVSWYEDVYNMEIEFDPAKTHLGESRAKRIYWKVVQNFSIENPYVEIGYKILNELCRAERWAHSSNPTFVHLAANSGYEAVLHEAMDIILDITGACIGLRSLGVKEIYYLDWVNVGGGKIKFSHGELEVPAPATKYLLQEHHIRWKNTDVGIELATPTGVSILAGCNAKRVENIQEFNTIGVTRATGTRKAPPVSFYLVE